MVQREDTQGTSYQPVLNTLPMRGIEDEPGGVEWASSFKSRKNATNIFIPGKSK